MRVATPWTLKQVVVKILKSPDSIPLLSALSVAGSMAVLSIIYHFKERNDFKALRISSNKTPVAEKPVDFKANRLIWTSNPKDLTPPVVKETLKAMREK